ncbi:cyclin-dependent kinase G-1 [Oryza brachyantha]|uniref:Protein kinase domain-containing protein n=1 Tax=Oryza brachyantha TaxID=4533 RepID=J3LEI8_ORYBR|nr:cyclin-dependent kinase G-1 [Oryza brachyantha]XP_040377321.1 cyclin-dependent kinase G-1 [Oryza brachyantha]XP_040377322.1 cyclin-dependent kinase G-1 [Oryza brachyantha]
MAAGSHGGYRGYAVAREREHDLGVSRRSKDYYHHRHPSRHRDSERRRDGGRSSGRELLNGHSHRRSPHPPSRRCSSGGRTEDREPGEVSSGSGSERSGEPPLKTRELRENGVARISKEDTKTSPSKKRKQSPVVWDRNGLKLQARHPVGGEVDAVASEIVMHQSQSLPVTSSPSSVADGHSPMILDVSVDSRKPQEHEKSMIVDDEEEKYPTMRNILTSRWADADDEEEKVVVPKKKKSVSPMDSIEQRFTKKVTSPELGELLVPNSAGSSSRSSDSGVVQGSASRDLEVEKVDNVHAEEEAGDDYPAGHLLDSDSEGDVYRSGTPECTRSPRRCINMLQGCRSVDEFERLNTINEGTYGVVFRVRDKRTGEIVALKKVKMEREREGFPLTSLREINILLSFHHPSIVEVKEVVVGSSDRDIFMVMEYMEHDLKGVMETMKQPYSQSEVKCLMLQLLEGVKYLHDNWVLHRDLKTSNLLLNNCGELKICDFGLSRQYGSPLKPYTQLVVTLWYRAPELLLGAKEYSTAIDMWSLGCIMAELLSKGPLFNGKSEIDQLDKIFKTLGTPDENIWPGYSKLPGATAVKFGKQTHNRLRDKFRAVSFTGGPMLSEAGFDLLNRLLAYDPEKRISADDALNHEWFRELPLPRSKDFMPTFPALNEQDRRFKKHIKSPDPLEEQRMKEQGNNGDRGLFG